ncbi:MAG TPA: shikimate kinase [Firmicutes bacterium]|nr:shikimate kinase [Bacillota bacterium]
MSVNITADDPGDPGAGRAPGIVLIGLMGAGKSAVGRTVAAESGLPFVDLDRVVQARAGTDIPTIFALGGEEAFRELEWQALQELAGTGGDWRSGQREGPRRQEIGRPVTLEGGSPRGIILATGGGTPCREETWPLLRRLGLVVWLMVDPAVAAARLLESEPEVSGRPLLQGAATGEELVHRLTQLLSARTPWYERADVRVETNGRTVAEIAAEVRRAWESARTGRSAPA